MINRNRNRWAGILPGVICGLLICVPAHTALAADTGNSGTTVLTATVSAATVRPGAFFRVKFNWEAIKPLPEDYSVFVHFLDKQGKIVFQSDHTPPAGTGPITYEKLFSAPDDITDGSYRIMVGLENKQGRLTLKAGAGVTADKELRYQVATLTVNSNVVKPGADTEKPVTLNLNGYKMTFNEDFNQPLDVSAWGPGTRWIAHTPWNGDFGDAAFANPTKDFPFTIENGILRIEARKDDAFIAQDPYKRPWRGGLLSSNDAKGNGFSQQYGYFEMRAKLPGGTGIWPAFWLCSSYDRTDPKAGNIGAIEIDVIEYYGSPVAYSEVMHVWAPGPHRGEGTTISTLENQVTSGFHNYGCMVGPEWTMMYFDGIEVWKTETPPEHKRPLMFLLNLALGSGWPIDKVPNPSFMYVDWVRAYAK